MDPRTICTANSNTSSPCPSTSENDKIPNKTVQLWRRAYQSLGFQKAYNFSLFIIFAGVIVGFSLARLSYLNISGSASSSYANGASPGEWYWYSHGIYRIGITIHLATILPAGLLMVWQFVPVIRHKYLMAHRINGYLVVTLVIISNVGALMIARRAFGGALATQAGVGVLVIMSTVSIALAYYNIKRLQIDQHRAWIQMSSYNTTMTCGELLSILDTDEKVNTFYPSCGQPGSTPATLAIVQAKFGSQPEQIASALRVSFGMALWMALFLHATGVEIYLGLTPRENNRLRQVSYERQLEKGLSPAGSAGLTSDRWGDGEPWQPLKEVIEK
ncbi:MAG: hypothetical protein LQ339_005558 [Xanthoria mediterranea]|nr:MAG: hypothetical protein LQ339_005558 [Xanthoria mediterranea]